MFSGLRQSTRLIGMSYNRVLSRIYAVLLPLARAWSARAKDDGGMADNMSRKILTFDEFRRLANDPALSREDKIDAKGSREGKTEVILRHIVNTLPRIQAPRAVVFDIGCGCSEVTDRLITYCAERGHQLVLVDSPEMLGMLPAQPGVRKVGGRFPLEAVIEEHRGRVDVVIVYSVLQYVFAEANAWDFVDAALQLLSEGGEMLLGDLPNVSKRKRFFSSTAGINYHRKMMQTDEAPAVSYNLVERREMDDAFLLGLIARVRSQGFDAYIQPQPSDLPLANRREDILIRRP
jgi:hypothetical protein